MKRVAGVERVVAPSARMVAYAEGFSNDARDCTQLVARLRNGRAILLDISPDNENLPEMHALWHDLVEDLYASLRSAYARFALIRAMDGHEAATRLWDDLMPSTDDLRDLGLHALFVHFRGAMQQPCWMTANEGRCVVQALWPPVRGMDALDVGVMDVTVDVPF